MRIIGLLIAIALVSLLFAWWIGISLDRTSKVMITTPTIEENQNTQNQPGVNPIDYSKRKVEEINELNQDRAKEIDNLP
ncbi:hypothetical protein ACFL0F_01420 [Patescibacteria group bacterium]